MSLDPFKAGKRQWKRYDPEPEKPCSKCEWLPWETELWRMYLVVMLLLVVFIIAVSKGHTEPVPAKQQTTTYAGERR